MWVKDEESWILAMYDTNSMIQSIAQYFTEID